MRQLSALDAQFLNFETETNVANIAGLSILDGPLTREELVRLVRHRSASVAPLRQRMMSVPFGLDHPYWVQDDTIDLDYHVRELALPAPGDDAQLGEQVARLHARRLDRGHPLWEMYLIHGLQGGRTGLYVKLHHAAIDGMMGADVLAAFMDLGPSECPSGEEPADAPEAEHGPETVEMLVRTAARLVTNPAHLLRFLVLAAPRLDEIPIVSRMPGAVPVSRATRRLSRWLGGGDEVPELPRLTVPRTPFNGPVSAHRRFAFVDLPLDDVKRVKNAFGVSVNDVVMTLAATALRRWLIEHDALPDEPLVAGVPFSLRDVGADAPGNQVTLMITSLDTQIADPRERLQAVHKAMGRIKDRFNLASARWLRHLSESMPAALTGLADRAALSLISQTTPPVNLIVSNVPGPQIPLYVCGRRLLAQYPVSVVTDASGGLNITAFSYNGRIAVGIVADRKMVPDVWALTAHLKDALEELKTLTPSS
ncbi:wax ester/triacylglycerol synthase family O-acyltransferase [Sphaerisporangium sp. TRM90804]|uniref:WS/DGAT/MGAT family O-acyltransferase n=1 Tax=Sphaerisporangium sp. TRM90804 TaxID=3031113 RepID=UPI00244B6B04|nr:wax ester/triacylglycerol synthase family O-acyltransferase [Sphaerisporangium sp. TRM90804]MDH2424450.1 wax ester/triacylglycerol synthase family O-acyltransferase [Sphaerisporangium sp. TRM90804]